MNPASFALFAWETGYVFTLRSMQLWAEPAKAQAALTEMALEKQRAFTAGWMAAGRAAMRGADPAAIATAALNPARRRVRINAGKLRRGD